jgi:DUF438 domain-containing protein
MSTGASLSELMNAMISRLEYTHPEEMDFAHESKKWEMIGTYVSVDPVLASLYKEYCAAKENLGKLLVDKGAQDPMTEIAWDVHDSLRSAIETRLLELKDDGEVSSRILAIQRNKFASMIPVKTLKKPKKETQTLNDMMAFMIWAGMVMQNNPAAYDIRRDFSRAS